MLSLLLDEQISPQVAMAALALNGGCQLSAFMTGGAGH